MIKPKTQSFDRALVNPNIYPKAIGLQKIFGYIPTALVESEKGFFTFYSLVVIEQDSDLSSINSILL